MGVEAAEGMPKRDGEIRPVGIQTGVHGWSGMCGSQTGGGDILLGAKLRVRDNDEDESYHEGLVVGYETLCNDEGIGQCLRMLVQRRVIDGVERPLDGLCVVLVDLRIPQRRVMGLRARARV